MKLFDDKKRINLDFGLRNKNSYNYLNDSNRPEIKMLRTKLEGWFENYSKIDKYEIKQRIKKEEHFDSVLFELYLYHFFLQMNFVIEHHPKMDYSTNKPDFLLTKNNIKIYVEAKVDYNLSSKLQKKENRRNHLIDNINNIKSDKYRIVIIEKEILSENQPTIKGFRKHMEKQFSNLNHKNIIEITKKGIKYLESYKYEDKDLYIKYKILGFNKGYNDYRLIQMNGLLTDCLDSEVGLRNSLNKKSKRYGKMKAPFIISINSLDVFLGIEEFKSVILGSFKNRNIIEGNNKIAQTQSYRENNGFFSLEKSQRNENVTAVLIYKNFGLGDLENPKYWLFKNPNAKYPLDKNFIEL